MEADKLIELGLTKREAHAYIALLKLEEAKAGKIAEFTKEDRTNIYDSLKSLIKKGLISYVKKENKTYYKVASPEKLKDFLAEKEKTLQEMLPDLNKAYKSYKQKPSTEVFEGKEGIKTVLSDILREEKDFIGFGATDIMFKLFPEFTERYLAERARKKIHARQIYPEGGKVLPSKFSTFKSIPREFCGPITTLVYGDKVASFMWFTEPLVVILIKNKEAAESYKRQFEFMWKMIR
jgi:sugar-specific transcriptional regulator TrmB